MELYEESIMVPRENIGEASLVEYFCWQIKIRLRPFEIPIRFVITKTYEHNYCCELGILSARDRKFTFNSIFDFRKRSFVNHDKFNVVLIIPTGIGCEIGGHSGDAGPVARLVGAACDNLILHPNVVNAADINEMPANSLYVEGSVISRLLMGTAGLQKVRINRILSVIGEHKDPLFHKAAINMVAGAKASFGIDSVGFITIPSDVKMEVMFSDSGRAAGTIKNIDKLYNIIKKADGYDAVAISSVINTSEEIRDGYFNDNISVNPWGGVEAMLTHFTSSVFNIPSAHAPMDESLDDANAVLEMGIVDPRKASEVISVTFFFSVLKGLHRSPKIINNISQEMETSSNIITAADVSCVVIPNGCVGLPTLAALEQDIPVIVVEENKNIMKNDLSTYSDHFIYVKNYFEAVGVIEALREGIALDSISRPLKHIKEL